MKTKTPSMKIGDIRNIIESANWAKNWYTGGTPEENRRCDLPSYLLPHLARLDALQIPARFTRDHAERSHAIFAIGLTLARWQRSQALVSGSVK